MTRMEGGAYIGDRRVWFCHSDDLELPDCYTIATGGRYGDPMGYLAARGVVQGGPPAEQVIARIRGR